MLELADRRAPGIPTFVAETGTGTPIVFLHGTPATSAVWIPLLARLPGVHAFAVDRPGHGLSGAVDYATVPDLRSHAVRFLEALLDALGLDQAVIAGSSMGGLWGLWLALDRPSRVSAVVQLGAPPGLLSNRLPLVFGPLSVPWCARLMRRLDPPSPAATRRLFRMMGDPPAMLTQTFVDTFTASQRLPNVEGGTAHMIQQFVRFPGRFADRRLWLDRTELAQIRQPALFLWGPRDFVGAPPLGRRAVDVMPNARLSVLGEGHLPWLQDPASAAAEVSRFLDDVHA
jgi:pimeloyl-ACP methyl ester carboxylesterase